MTRNHEKLLVAALAGTIIALAATFAVQPAMAAGYQVHGTAQVTGIKAWDVLNVRKWPASHSKKTGVLRPHDYVWVERCIDSPQGGSDWCLVEGDHDAGWVNARYLTMAFGD